MNLQDAADKILYGAYDDIFPAPGDVKIVFRELSKVVHPDLYTGAEKDLATEAFQALNSMRTDAEQMAADGRYGQPVVMATIKTKRATHFVKRKLAPGDIAELYQVLTKSETGVVSGLLKVARSPRDNDLMAAEAAALKKLHSNPDELTLTRHIPIILDTFMHSEGRRRANVILWREGNYSLRQLMDRFPHGPDPRHVVWIWRRLLMGLGYTHDQGVVHGAVVPEHVLVEPVDHAVVLADWCYSSIAASGAYPPIKATVPRYDKDWYPPEVAAKTPPSAATDLYMAAYTMILLGRGALPRRLSMFFHGCMLDSQRGRPQDAWALLKEFDDLLRDIGSPFYPKRFVEFTVPPGAA